MLKELFLEYKFRDFEDQELLQPKPTGVIAALELLNQERVDQIRRLNLALSISLVALPGDICPASSQAGEFVKKKLQKAISFKPDMIWFDHLRFEGRWERGGRNITNTHSPCEYCGDKQRNLIIGQMAEASLAEIPEGIRTGYFAVPLMSDSGGWGELGHDPKVLGNLFDYVSPMLYHRMFGKDTSYISKYVRYLVSLGTTAQILPIVQLKDMPDDLEDNLSITEIQKEVEEAVKPPSVGVALFSWDQAIEKNKVSSVSKILTKLQ